MNNARFVSFASSHDLNQVTAGETFTATWRMRNTGTETWDGRYRVVHIHANRGSTLMTSKASYAFTDVASRGSVGPGEEVNITLSMTAPAPRDRRYFTDWQLQDPRGRRFGAIMWLRVVTVPPPVTDPRGFLKSDSKFIDDHTIPDGMAITEGEQFLKQWVVKNSGQRKWNENYRLVFVSGDLQMAGAASHRVPEADPGQQVVLGIHMTAPPARDEPYVSTWRLHDDRNIPFGDRFWVKIFSTAKVDGFGITPYSQNDPRWRNQILGHGPRTFGEFGCLVTCFSMMLSGFGEDLDPLALNRHILQLSSQGFSGSDVFFIAPAKVIDHVKYWGNNKPFAHSNVPHAIHEPDLINKIDNYLRNGGAVMLQVDKNPTTPYNFHVEQHWVLALARQGGDYLVLDPIDGRPVSLLRKYGRQSRPQNPNEALREAIKSALFYRSTRVPFGAGAGEGESGDGRSHIGPEELTYTGPPWPFGRCLTGLHDRADRHPQPADHAIARGRFEAIKVQSGVTVAEMKGYRADFVLCRLFETWNGRHVPVEMFVDAVEPDIAGLVHNGVAYFEFHNEPNLTHEGLNAAGVRGSWRNGAEFGQYFIRGRKLLQRRFSGIKVGFPGLSPGPDAHYEFGHDRGFRMNDTEFLRGAEAAIRAADFIGVHAYYVSMDEVHAAVELVKMYRRRWPDKLLFVTEFSNPDRTTSMAEKGRQAKEFYKQVKQIPGVGAAFYFVVSGTGWDHQALRRNASGRSTGMIEQMF